MNYSRNIKKISIGKRIIISWLIVAFVFFLVGLGFGAIIFTSSTKSTIYGDPLPITNTFYGWKYRMYSDDEYGMDKGSRRISKDV